MADEMSSGELRSDSVAPTELAIPLSKGKVILLLLAAVGLVAVGSWIWLIADSQTRHNPLFMKAVAIVGVSFFGFGALYLSLKVFDTRPGLIIDDQGIVDNSSAVAAGRVLWEEVVALRVAEIAGQRFVTIVVVDPQKFAGRGNFLSRMSNAASIKMTGSPINISSNALCLKFDELVHELTAAFERHQGAGRTSRCT